MGYSVDRLSNLLVSFTAATSTSASQLSANAGWTGLASGQQQSLSSVWLTNNDVSATIFVGFSNTVSSTSYFYALPPQGILPVDLQHMGRGPFTKLWVVASTGAPNITVSLMGA